MEKKKNFNKRKSSDNAGCEEHTCGQDKQLFTDWKGAPMRVPGMLNDAFINDAMRAQVLHQETVHTESLKQKLKVSTNGMI
eukprot:4228317-Amphidinium_carterae.1